MPDVLLYGDTERSAALRHELPVAIGDPFLYAEVADEAYVTASALERERLARARPGVRLLDIEELGFHDLLNSGLARDAVDLELVSRAAAATEVQQAIVDFEFPLGVAERLRADGIELIVDEPAIARRRRIKSPAELAGIRRAQESAQAAMAGAAGLLAQARAIDDRLYLDGEPLLAETIREAMRQACFAQETLLAPDVIVASVWQGYGHEPGHGPLPAGLPIEIDLWPLDETSGCWADMTRTFVVGGQAPAEVARQERLVSEALERCRAAVRPGVTGKELHAIACEIFERDGYATQRTGPGDDPAEGFQFSLGHGVGLRVHEEPGLGPAGLDPLVAGDVLALEPGLWQRDVGGVRLEDLLLVTDTGSQTLTDFPYQLTP